MRSLILATVCALASLLSGCVYSVHPLLQESDLTKEFHLSGTWKPQGGQVPEITDAKQLAGYTFTAKGFSKGAASQYDISWANNDFVAQIGRIGDDYYVQVQKSELTPEAPPLLTALPVYAIAKIKVTDDKLEVFKIDETRAVQFMKKRKVPFLPYIEFFVLTGTTESLQDLVRQSGGDLFSKTPMTFTRTRKPDEQSDARERRIRAD